MLVSKAFYFFYFAAFAALLPFLILYYEQLGFSGQHIGFLSAMFPLMMLLSAPLLSGIADTTARYKPILLLLIALSIAVVLALGFVSSFAALLTLIALFAFLTSPILPIGDSATLDLLGEDKSNYGRVRMWGAVGWGLSAPVVGLLTERLNLSWAFYAYAVLMLGCLYSSWRLPLLPARSQNTGFSLRGLFSMDWLFFLIIAFLGGVGLAVSGNFVYLHLANLSAGAVVVGLALSVATLSELPPTFFGKQLLTRFSTRHLLLAALGFFVLRLFLYGVFHHPLLILLVQLLHGFSFSLMWIAGVAYADKLAPAGKQATAQGLFSAVMMGLGSAVGGISGGYLYDAVGSSGMFYRVGSGLSLGFVGLLVWELVIKQPAPQHPQET